MSYPGILLSSDIVEGSCIRDIASVKNENVGMVVDLPSYGNTTCLGWVQVALFQESFEDIDAKTCPTRRQTPPTTFQSLSKSNLLNPVPPFGLVRVRMYPCSIFTGRWRVARSWIRHPPTAVKIEPRESAGPPRDRGFPRADTTRSCRHPARQTRLRCCHALDGLGPEARGAAPTLQEAPRVSTAAAVMAVALVRHGCDCDGGGCCVV